MSKKAIKTAAVAASHLTAVKMELLDNALNSVGQYDPIANAIAAHGPEFIGECLAELNGTQVIGVLKKLQKNITRQVYAAFAQAEREQRIAVAGQGVNGREISICEMASSWLTADWADDTPKAVTLYHAALELYVELQGAYLLAEKVAYGWRDGFEPEGLPFYYLQNESNDSWMMINTLEEAFRAIEGEREQFKAKKAEADRQALANLRNLKLVK